MIYRIDLDMDTEKQAKELATESEELILDILKSIRCLESLGLRFNLVIEKA